MHAHRHPARDALDPAHQVERVAAHGHAVGEAHHAGIGVERRLEHEGAWAVAPLDPPDRTGRCDQPPAVLLVTEQCGEAGAESNRGT